MKINRDDPWYPCVRPPDPTGEHWPGVTIGLKLAAEMAKGILAGLRGRSFDMSLETRSSILADAELLADAMIERANHDERNDDGKRDMRDV